MDFTLDESEQAIADLAQQVLADASSHEQLRALEHGSGARFDQKLWATLAETGILGAFVPAAHGGAGLGLVAMAATLEAAGRCAAAVPLWEPSLSASCPWPSSPQRTSPRRSFPQWPRATWC
ncbi:MAG: acyl-CoA dehydrogenase family protein [Microthrixaceae bacterium]